MSNALLQVENLNVNTEDAQILHDVNLQIHAGEVHVLMGPNGAGKSTLGNTIMGSPAYHVTSGKILFEGENLTDEPTDKRAKKGIFLSFQNPLEVPGITLFSFIRSAMEQRTGQRVKLWEFRKRITAQMSLLQMDPSYLERDLNVGFSGGEKKKAEILQLLALQPKLAILDETDSGLDVDAVRTVSEGVKHFMEDGTHALLIITHSTRILEALHIDRVHVLVNGRITAEGGAELVSEINENGFEQFVNK